MSLQLWNHQNAAIKATLDAMKKGQDRGLWVLPTGTGKTVAFLSLAARLGKPTLVIVHRDELIRQTIETCGQVWPDASIATFPEHGWEQADVVVATVQTLARSLEQIPPDHFGLVIVDEAHHAPAVSWDQVISHFTPQFLLGCTATPERLDKKDVGEVFGGRPLYEYQLDQAMMDGYLVPVRQHGIRTNASLAGVKFSRGDFSSKALAKVVVTGTRTRDVVNGYLDHAADRPALFFAVDVAHIEQLVAALVAKGIKAAGVTGKMPLEKRRKILEDFRKGKRQVLVSCEVLTEGYDERRVSCVVMARPTASLGFYQQSVGRGLRIDSEQGKVDCLVLDVIDRGAGRRVQTATCLFSAPVEDCGGRDVRLVAAQEKARWRLEPLARTPSQDGRLERDEDTEWPELPTLHGYISEKGWQAEPATDKQLKALAKYGCESRRPITKGEAGHLINECKRLDALYPTPATNGQRYLLAKHGVWRPGMGKREATRLTGWLHASGHLG